MHTELCDALGIEHPIIQASLGPFIQQVPSVEQAERAVEQGADVVIAQGEEAGGFGGGIGGLALTPQVVDAVAPVPVVAAGGIADGPGLLPAGTIVRDIVRQAERLLGR